MVVALIALAIEIDALGHGQMLESKLRAYAEKIDGLFGQKQHLLFNFCYFFLIVVLDAFFKKRSNFGAFEQEGHDQIVSILILDQSSLP